MWKLSALLQSTLLPQDFTTPQGQYMGSELSTHSLSLSSHALPPPLLSHLIYLLLTLYTPLSCVSRPSPVCPALSTPQG